MQFKHWQKDSIERIYLQDVPGVAGRAYLYVQGGVLLLSAEQLLEERGHVMQALAEEVGATLTMPAKRLFDAFKAHALSGSRAKPGPRGRHAVPRATAGTASGFGGQAYGTDLAFGNIKNPLPVTVEIDHREPSGFEAFLAQVENLTVERVHLPIGDFRVNGRIIIERKTVLDFAGSVQSGHVFDQAQRMGFEPDAIGVVVIEGDVFRGRTGMLASAVTGAITCLSFVQRMTVVNTINQEHTSFLVAKLAQHDRNGLGYALPLHKDKPTALIDAQRYLLESVNGVSGGLSDALLRHFGTVQAVFNATEKELLQVKGVGPKTAKRLRDVLVTPYNAPSS